MAAVLPRIASSRCFFSSCLRCSRGREERSSGAAGGAAEEGGCCSAGSGCRSRRASTGGTPATSMLGWPAREEFVSIISTGSSSLLSSCACASVFSGTTIGEKVPWSTAFRPTAAMGDRSRFCFLAWARSSRSSPLLNRSSSSSEYSRFRFFFFFFLRRSRESSRDPRSPLALRLSSRSRPRFFSGFLAFLSGLFPKEIPFSMVEMRGDRVAIATSCRRSRYF